MSSFEIPKLSDKQHLLPKHVQQRMLSETKAGRPDGPLWIFAFGSLMWNPGFEFDISDTAILPGWERKFHIWTTVARGTPERPGLGLCLKRGDTECKGIVYRLLPKNEEKDWEELWFREMNSGVYQTLWTDVETENHGSIKALTFVADTDHPQHVGPLPIDVMAEIMVGACGRYGRCRDYLAGTVEEMEKLGVIDLHLNELLEKVDSRDTQTD
jgi:cation transport protein ChaC